MTITDKYVTVNQLIRKAAVNGGKKQKNAVRWIEADKVEFVLWVECDRVR